MTIKIEIVATDDELLREYHSLSQDLTLGKRTVELKNSFEKINNEIEKRGLDPMDYFK